MGEAKNIRYHWRYAVALANAEYGRVDKNEPMSRSIDRLVNIVLIAPVVLLALAAFFALQEILLTVSARIIVANMDSTVRGSYALGTVRNFWLLGGGACLVGILIYVLDSAFKHWRTRRLRRLLLRVLAVELAIIGAGLVIVQ